MTGNEMVVVGRLVLDDRVEEGRVTVEDGWITAVEPVGVHAPTGRGSPFIAPGFVDVHVHGGGGHDAMGDAAALTGMARHLLRHGITAFLPTAVSAPLSSLVVFAERVRAWLPDAPSDGAEPLGFNLEGPFLADARRGAHDPTCLRNPADLRLNDLEQLVEGLRLLTIAPELPGAIELIGWLLERGVATSLGHSAATVEQARAGYAAGATSTTHLFNAMSGVPPPVGACTPAGSTAVIQPSSTVTRPSSTRSSRTSRPTTTIPLPVTSRPPSRRHPRSSQRPHERR